MADGRDGLGVLGASLQRKRLWSAAADQVCLPVAKPMSQVTLRGDLCGPARCYEVLTVCQALLPGEGWYPPSAERAPFTRFRQRALDKIIGALTPWTLKRQLPECPPPVCPRQDLAQRFGKDRAGPLGRKSLEILKGAVHGDKAPFCAKPDGRLEASTGV